MSIATYYTVPYHKVMFDLPHRSYLIREATSYRLIEPQRAMGAGPFLRETIFCSEVRGFQKSRWSTIKPVGGAPSSREGRQTTNGL